MQINLTAEATKALQNLLKRSDKTHVRVILKGPG